MKLIPLLLFLILPLALALNAAEPIQLKGWTLQGQMDVYEPDNLWELINGAADAYLSYGFKELKAFELTAGQLHYMVHIYDMGNPLSAFGIYRNENPPLDDSVAIGAETQFSDFLAVMFSGRYYVKVESIKGKVSEGNSRSLMEELYSVLGGGETFPAELALLPAEGKRPETEYYIRDNFLGVSELSNALFARYERDGLTFRRFVIPNQDPNAFLGVLPPSWSRTQMAENTEIYQREIPYIGLVGIMVHGGTLCGVVDIKDEVVMRQLLNEWREAK